MRRYALYYAPDARDALWQAGCAWLDPRAPLAGLAEITAEPRRYGFHATLKPPMQLIEGADVDAVLAAARAVAGQVPAFALPPLAVADWHGFLCLRETLASPSLQALADACVAGLDHLRAAPDAAELARRRGGGLTRAQDANLLRWGYPHVFATWFFHMTLSRRLTSAELPDWRAAATRWFAAALAQPRHVRALCVFEQPGADEPFHVIARLPLAAD